MEAIPRLGAGKPDYSAIRELAAQGTTTTGVRELFAHVLRIPLSEVDRSSTFVGLGGDSMSFVTMSVRLEKMLGALPLDWHTSSVAELEANATGKSGFWRTIESGILLRALAIVLVVGSHSDLWNVWGGAHFLLAASGYYFARFILADKPRKERIKHSLGTIIRIAIPYWIWVAAVRVFIGGYALTNFLMINRIVGPDNFLTLRVWYVEVLVGLLVLATALIATPLFDRFERRWPFYFALGVVAIGLGFRWTDAPFKPDFPGSLFSLFAGFFFAFGWAAAKATATWQRLLISALLLASLYGYFDAGFSNVERTVLVLTSVLLLIWVPRLKVPGLLVPAISLIANASLYIYLVQWQVLEHGHGVRGATISLIAGVVLYFIGTKAMDYGQPKVVAFLTTARRAGRSTPSSRRPDPDSELVRT